MSILGQGLGSGGWGLKAWDLMMGVQEAQSRQTVTTQPPTGHETNEGHESSVLPSDLCMKSCDSSLDSYE